MRLKLKIVYLFAWYFFKVKKKLKMDIGGIGVLSLLVIFLGIPNFSIFFFFLIQILRFHRKMCRLFPCIPIFRGFFD